MRIRSDDSWRWYYDKEHDRMMPDLANGVLFRLRFIRKVLTPDAFPPVGFCVDDAVLYLSSEERCRDSNLSKEQKAEPVLNTLVVIHYLKPQMLKSWHFTSHGKTWMPMPSGVVCIWLSDTHEQVNLLIVESGEDAALCLLAQPCVVIASRAMWLGDAIKIMDDRLELQVNADSFSLEQAVQCANLSAVFGTRP